MTYSEPLSNQLYRFILALGFGIILGIIYEIIVLIRTLVSERKGAIIAQDIVFSIIFSVMSFFFMLIYNEGEIRLNLIFAQLLGIVTFHITVAGRITKSVEKIRNKLRLKKRKTKIKTHKS